MHFFRSDRMTTHQDQRSRTIIIQQYGVHILLPCSSSCAHLSTSRPQPAPETTCQAVQVASHSELANHNPNRRGKHKAHEPHEPHEPQSYTHRERKRDDMHDEEECRFTQFNFFVRIIHHSCTSSFSCAPSVQAKPIAKAR